MANIGFVPVRGTQEQIDETSIVDGQLLFNTETSGKNKGRMYLDVDSQRLDVGGDLSTELTQAEYDLLSEEEKKIGTYYITDAKGTSVGALKKNIDTLNDSLQANGNQFYFDYQDGQYGFNTDENRGADTFVPFKSGLINLGIKSGKGTITFSATDIPDYASLTEENFIVSLVSGENDTGFSSEDIYWCSGGLPAYTVSKSYNAETGVLTVTGLPDGSLVVNSTGRGTERTGTATNKVQVYAVINKSINTNLASVDICPRLNPTNIAASSTTPNFCTFLCEGYNTVSFSTIGYANYKNGKYTLNVYGANTFDDSASACGYGNPCTDSTLIQAISVTSGESYSIDISAYKYIYFTEKNSNDAYGGVELRHITLTK